MIIGAHVIFGAYGFWLPNDPRGSWSSFVGSYDLFRYGTATKTIARHSLASNPHDRQLRMAAKNALQRRPVQFDDSQVQAVGDGFGTYIAKSDLVVLACAVVRDHVHLVMARSSMKIESRVIQLKASATTELMRCGLHPFQDLPDENGRPSKCFARGEWKVYLEQPEDLARAARYVEGNPEKEGLSKQHWPFVTPLSAWLERSAARRG